ncbi:MAG: hypothetical protein HY537_09255 [Deltaproteobacteria bacterium]|nr:hypothetical protein [Deltaproteobacteria bacterium]
MSFTVEKRTLVLLAGALWLAVGMMLLRLSYQWLEPFEFSEIWTNVMIGIVLAVLACRFLFVPIALKNIDRLIHLSGKLSVYRFMPLKSYFIVFLMITLGISLRHSPVPKHWLAIPYLTMGLALFGSSLCYFRCLGFFKGKSL